jgi:hypothetical protein
MTSSVQSPADAINIALRRIGHKLRIGSLYEGSEAARKAIDFYGQTRDALLRSGDWGFAQRDVALTLLKKAPPGGYMGQPWTSAYPMLPYLFEYTYPSDCIRVLSIKQTPIFVPNFDPQPNVFSVDNDNSYTPAMKVIVCNVPQAILCYTGRVTDPSNWEADFTEALIDDLARTLAAGFASEDYVKLEAAVAQSEAQTAEAEQG